MRFARFALACTVVLSLAPRLAVAEPSEAPELAARRHFEEGTKLFNLGEFSHAVVEYKSAYKAKADPVFLYNIAQAYRLGGDLANAVFFYRSYLRNQPATSNRRDVEARIRTLELQLQQQKVVTTTPPNSAVPPGGSPAQSADAAPETPSAPVVGDGRPAPEPATVGGPTSATSATRAPADGTHPELVAAKDAPADSRTPVYKKWWLWTIVGAVAVGAGVGLGVGLGTASHQPSTHFGTTTLTF